MPNTLSGRTLGRNGAACESLPKTHAPEIRHFGVLLGFLEIPLEASKSNEPGLEGLLYGQFCKLGSLCRSPR